MKIKGFTISEVMIGLLVCSVITAIISQLWVQTNTLVHTFNTQQDHLTDESLHQVQMELDLYRSNDVTVASDEQLNCKLPEKKNVSYLIRNGTLGRSYNDRLDTLSNKASMLRLHTICNSNLVDSFAFETEHVTITYLPRTDIADHLKHCTNGR